MDNPNDLTIDGVLITEAKTGYDGPSEADYITRTGFYVRKYMDEKTESDGGSAVSFIRYRYGEVLLNAAEAAYEFDLPLLKLFYSIILADIKNTINQNQYAINESFTIYLPDLAELMGKGRNLSDNDIIMLRNKTGAFQTIYGIIRDPKYPKRIGSALPLLVSLGYDDTTNTIRFSSPYMLRLIQTLYNVKVRQSKLNLNKITEPAKFLISEHSSGRIPYPRLCDNSGQANGRS